MSPSTSEALFRRLLADDFIQSEVPTLWCGPPNPQVTAAQIVSVISQNRAGFRTSSPFTRHLSGRIDASSRQPDVWIRVSHQPNLFAYWRLVGLLVYVLDVVQELSRIGIDAQAFWVLNDYDDWSDSHVRRALLPSNRGQGNIGLTVQFDHALHPSLTVASLPEPSKTWLLDIEREVREAFKSYVRLLDRSEQRAAESASESVLTLLSSIPHSNLSELSTEFVVRAVERLRSTRILTVSGKELLLEFQDEIEQLIGDSEALLVAINQVTARLGPQRALDRAPVKSEQLYWILCSCGARHRANEQNCPACQMKSAKLALLPGILMDELLDGSLFRPHVAISHGGSVRHGIVAHGLRQEYGAVPMIDEYFSYMTYNAQTPFRTTNSSRQLREKIQNGQFSHIFTAWCLEAFTHEGKEYNF